MRRRTEEPTIEIKDSQSLMSAFLGERRKIPDENTRICSAFQLDNLNWLHFKAKVLGMQLYEDEAAIEEHLMISKDGLGRTEAVDSLRSINADFMGYNQGIAIQAIEDQQKRRGR